MFRPIAFLLTLLLVSACTTSEFTPSQGAHGLPPYEGPVDVLEALPPRGEYQHLGVVIVDGAPFSSEKSLLKALKAAAAERGGNAVVLQGKARVTRNMQGGRSQLGGTVIRRGP